MADRPILFSAPMVCALLEGRKTQTRRILKPRKGLTLHELITEGDQTGNEYRCRRDQVQEPRFAVGDRLYVREAWRAEARLDKKAPRDINTNYPGIKYIATDEPDDFGIEGKYRQAMHMPRWASRLTLIVTDVRVERLQDVSEEDAIAEGAELSSNFSMVSGGQMVKISAGTYLSPVAWYHWLWDQINGKGAWDKNPWVVAYTFTVLKQNIDEVK